MPAASQGQRIKNNKTLPHRFAALMNIAFQCMTKIACARILLHKFVSDDTSVVPELTTALCRKPKAPVYERAPPTMLSTRPLDMPGEGGG